MQIPPASSGGDLPAWYHVVPAGEFRGRDGRGPYRLLSPGDVVEAFAAWGGDLCVDYEHQTLSAAQKAGPVPAAGWVKGLEAREDGLWARIEWTEIAAAALKAKEYRYLSPVFEYVPANGEVRVLTMVALTNIPNLHLQAAASRQGDLMNELMERLCYMLNLPLTTTPEEMAAQLDKLKAMLADATATAAASAELAKAIGLAPDAPIATVAQSIQAKLTQAPDPAQYVPKDQYDQVAHSLAELQGAAKVDATTRLVEEAMSAGKVPPALKTWATQYATRDPEGFRDYLSTAPVITGSAHSGAAGQAPGTETQTLNSEEETVAHALGLSTEAFLIAKKEVD